MELVFEGRVGRKYAIYLLRAVVKAMGIKEGDKVILRVSGNKVVIERVADPLELAISGRKFASIKPDEVERVSVEEQERRIKGLRCGLRNTLVFPGEIN